MTLLVPNAAEVLALKAFLNNTAGQDQTLKLFATNVTPAETDTAASYTEAAGGGYASKSLTGASSWTFTSGAPSDATASQQTWTFTGALTTNPTVYGYFLVQASSGTILWAEAFTSFTPANNGDQILLTPKITCD